MRNLVFRDKLIPQKEYDQLLADYSAFIKKYTGITPIFWTKEYDYTDYPTDVDVDGDDVPRPTMLQDIADYVTAKYGNYGADNIIVLIHESNWKSGATAKRKGISGTNYSYRYNNYHLQYVRWWGRKGKTVAQELVNTFGTLNHEQTWHSADALIKVELGIDINHIIKEKLRERFNGDKEAMSYLNTYGFIWDRDAVHGGVVINGERVKQPMFEYINYQQNSYILEWVAPYLVAAYAQRQEKHTEYIKGLKLTAIGLLERLVTLYRERLYQKNGNPKK
jgi:hypothetical protein